MDLREEFKKETGLRIIVEDRNGNSFYTEDYVEWLEDKLVKKLSISDVIQTLNDFHEWSLTQEAMFDDRLIPNYIEYLKSFNGA
jgi:hypothetical protein